MECPHCPYEMRRIEGGWLCDKCGRGVEDRLPLVSVSEGRELLIRQIAAELQACVKPYARLDWCVEITGYVLNAAGRLGFEVIPASTLEAERSIVQAARAWAAGEMSGIGLRYVIADARSDPDERPEFNFDASHWGVSDD